ncbi:hypothetical protein TDB9533_03948 [Thalassocella blandensis]|nr:hypothetical protein TDB9533_03948 [Thalassocella blandensis]
MDNKTNKKIDRSLVDSAKAIEQLKKKLKDDEAQLPKTALKMEDRLQDLQQELDSISDKMLAYKLRRIADSKMLASVAKLSQGGTEEKEKAQDFVGEKAVKKTRPANVAKRGEAGTEINLSGATTKLGNLSAGKSNKTSPGKENTKYQSSTFQCKSDLDQCLIDTKHPIEKALCYALFIRCAIKG